MRRVDQAEIRPHYCAVLPHLGQAHRKGYFDTGNEVTAIDPHIYVSVEAVEVMARELGWVGPEEHAAVLDRVAALEAELAQEQARAGELQATFDAIDVLESKGFRARKKPGRPAKAEQGVA